MKYLLIILTFSLFLLLPVKIRIKAFKKESDEYIRLGIDFFKMSKVVLEISEIKFTIENFIPVLNFKYHFNINNRNDGTFKSKKNVILPLRGKYKIIISKLEYVYKYPANLKKIIIRCLSMFIIFLNLNINITFSSGNAAFTGILAGQAWCAVYIVLRIFSTYTNFDYSNVKVNINPVFTSHEPLEIEINCIFQARVGHIIIASLIFAWYWILSEKRILITNRHIYNKKEQRSHG